MQRHLQASTRLAEYLDWPGVSQVCRLQRTTICAGETTTEIQYAISSLPRERGGAEILLDRWHGHWGIESHHWLRDVTFGEDKCQVKCGHAPQNLAAFRNVVINLLRHRGHKQIAGTLREFSYQTRKLLRFLGILKI